MGRKKKLIDESINESVDMELSNTPNDPLKKRKYVPVSDISTIQDIPIDKMGNYFTIETWKYAEKWDRMHLKSQPTLPHILPFADLYGTFLGENLVSKYIPENNFDVKFACVDEEGEHEGVNLHTLPLFQAEKHTFSNTESYILNCGGPIWGLDWCPYTPYFAVASHRSFFEFHVITEPKEPTSGVIQIWHFDCISQETPVLSVLLYHDFSPVFTLKFCPNDQTINCQDEGATTSRIGLLAFCGCDDLVRMAVIPSPKNINTSGKAYPLQICALLQTFRDDCIDGPTTERSHRATCFAWNPTSPHNIVVVGYSTGRCSIFDLGSDNNLIKLEKNNVTTYLPIFTINVMTTPVINVLFHPHLPDIFIPVGWDANLLMYSTCEARCPVMSFDKGSSSVASFPTSANFLLIADEFRKCPNTNSVRMSEFCRIRNAITSETVEKNFMVEKLLKNASTIKDMTCCPYTGFCVICETDGLVRISNTNDRLLKSRSARYPEWCIYTLSYANTPNIQSVEDKCVGNMDIFESETNKKLYKNSMIKLFEKGFIFKDFNYLENSVKLSKNTMPTVTYKGETNPSKTHYFEQFSFINPCSINRVSLNMTPGNRCWLVSGGNSGLLRVNCVSRWAENIGLTYFS